MEKNDLYTALLDPHCYPDRPNQVETEETHVSRLYLTEERVYKIKKAVDYGFLDFTTLAKRHAGCLAEVDLNRRFAAQTYLGVVEIKKTADGYAFGGSVGETVEYAVEMRRLPAERMLDSLIRSSDSHLPEEAERVGITLGELHNRMPELRNEQPGLNATIAGNWQENFDQTRSARNLTLTAEAHDLFEVEIPRRHRGLEKLIAEREAAGCVRDGHGDLHAEHICLVEPLQIYDCIEFNRRFRVDDLLNDLAFLLMDLDRHGRSDLAAIVLDAWKRVTAIPAEDELLDFYRTYRAFVRGKVDSFLAADENVDPLHRHQALDDARCYFSQALSYLVPRNAALILTCGQMGVGKSTVARRLGRLLNAKILVSDQIRRELYGLSGQPPAGRYGEGLYLPSRIHAVYDHLLSNALSEVAAQRPVIVDASFAHQSERRRFLETAERAGVPAFLLYLHCSETLALQRLEERWLRHDDPSDGRPELYPLQALHFTPPDANESPLSLDSELPTELLIQKILIRMITPTRH